MTLNLINIAQAHSEKTGEYFMHHHNGFGMMDRFGYGAAFLGWLFMGLTALLLILGIVALAKYIKGDEKKEDKGKNAQFSDGQN